MPRKPFLFELNQTAYGMLSHSRRHGVPACPKCRTSAKKAYIGRSVASMELDLWPKAGGGIRGFAMKLRCRSCGARTVVRSEAAATGEQQFIALRIFLATVGDAEEAATGQAEGPAAASSGAGMPTSAVERAAGSDENAARVVPSRRDPGAPLIGVDEAIDVIVAIRAARSWPEVLRVLGASG